MILELPEGYRKKDRLARGATAGGAGVEPGLSVSLGWALGGTRLDIAPCRGEASVE